MWRLMTNLSEKINEIKELLKDADCILIGAGAGLSTSAGIDYAGEEFQKEFTPFIKKYHFTDLCKIHCSTESIYINPRTCFTV